MASDRANDRTQPEAPAEPIPSRCPGRRRAPGAGPGHRPAAAGVALEHSFLVVGAVVVVAGLSLWIAQLLPGHGHVHEPLVEPRDVPQPCGRPGGVEHLRPGMPGYRLRLPQEVHPISAGVKGGIVGGVVMPVPALLWGCSAATASGIRSTCWPAWSCRAWSG